MECKECKIVCDGKEIATINCSEDGFNIKCTEEIIITFLVFLAV